MKRPALQPTGNAPGVGIDQADWDAATALNVALTGGRAERRAAQRWLKKHKQQFLALLETKQHQEMHDGQ